MMNSVDTLLMSQNHADIDAINQLRRFIKSIDPRILEEVKWNSPSFYLETHDHFLTLNLRDKTLIKAIFHQGARGKPLPVRIPVNDPNQILTWPANNRATVNLDSKNILEYAVELRAIIIEWIELLE